MTFLPVNGFTSPTIEVAFDYQNDPTVALASATWSDITPYVVSYSRQPVRTNEFDQPGPAGGTIVLRNGDSRFTPNNPSSPYFGGLKKFRRIRVRCQWAGVTYNRFLGHILDWPQSWDEAGKNQTVSLQLADAMLPLVTIDLGANKHSVYGSPGTTAQPSGSAMASVLSAAGVGPTSVDTGRSVVDQPDGSFHVTGPPAAQVYGPNSYALKIAQDIAASENGVVFADGGGTINFHDRAHRANPTLQATIGDGGGNEIPYVDPQPAFGDVWPIVNVTPHGASSPVVSINTAGVTSYFEQTLNFPTGGTYLVADANEALGAANYLAARYSNPITRIPSVTLVGAANTSLWPAILGLDTSQFVSFKRRLANGQTIQLNQFVEGYGDNVTVGQDWRVQVALSPADIQRAWVLDTSLLGGAATGSTTQLFY